MDVTKTQCRKLGCEKRRAPRQAYCSRDHAPYGRLGDDTRYDKRTEKLDFKGPGETSSPRSIYAKKIDYVTYRDFRTPVTVSTPEIKEKPVTVEIPKEDVKNPGLSGTLLQSNRKEGAELNHTPNATVIPIKDGPSGDKDMREIGKSIAALNMPGDDAVTPSTVSSPQSTVLEKAKSDSMTLIDESATHLRDLMKSVVVKDNPSGVLQACNCASQIHKLIRLKFDIVRSMT